MRKQHLRDGWFGWITRKGLQTCLTSIIPRVKPGNTSSNLIAWKRWMAPSGDPIPLRKQWGRETEPGARGVFLRSLQRRIKVVCCIFLALGREYSSLYKSLIVIIFIIITEMWFFLDNFVDRKKLPVKLCRWRRWYCQFDVMINWTGEIEHFHKKGVE